MTYSVDIPNLDLLQKQFASAPAMTTREVARAVNQSLVSLQATAKQHAPIDQGRLVQSILMQPSHVTGNLIEGSVGTNVKYAIYQEAGTGIYGPAKSPIVPKSKKALAFTVGGHKVVVRSVKGVPARRFMEKAVAENQAKIDGYFEAAARRISEQLARGVA